MPTIRLKNVTKKFGRVKAIDNLSLTIDEGEYLCVLGPTGAGKTTLLKLVAGVLKPSDGKIFFDKTIMNDVPPEDRNTVLVFQSFALFPHLTVLDNVLFGPLSKGMEHEKAFKIAMDTLDMVKLSKRANSYPNELSGGMQQRVALARSLASGAKTLLLDEPLGALDARLRTELRNDIKTLAKDLGLTAVHVTHDQEEAVTIADRIAILKEGKIEQIGTPIDLYNHPETIFVAHFLGGANLVEGVVRKTTRRGSVVDLGGNTEILVSGKKYRVGKLVVVGVRFEKTNLAPSSLDENSLKGTVEQVTFLGNSKRYDVKLEAIEKTLQSKLPSKAETQFSIGQKVYAHFAPNDCVLFPSPKHGLYKEIEVI
jgi:ABC-type Fe3+/spermidine/putrescine transport system ATPase subunit